MSHHHTRKPSRIAHKQPKAHPSPSPSALGARVLAPTAKRRTPRQVRAHELVEALVEAAAQLLVERGYEGASTNAIADRAGVSVGSLYQYFSGKSDVFREVMERHQAEVHPLVGRALRDVEISDEAPAPAIESLLHELLRVHARRPELMHAMDTQLGHVAHGAGDAKEAEAAIVLARILEHRGAGTHEDCRAFGWLLATVVSTVSRRLVHAPPAGVDEKAVVRGVGRIVEALFGGRR
jgi:AcrR family transcriptional regulator